jgi:hypothetical protein
MEKIVSKQELVAKIYRLKIDKGDKYIDFPHRLIRNYSLGTGTYNRPFRMQNIE